MSGWLRRGILNLTHKLKAAPVAPKYIGQDLHGNKFYEIESASSSRPKREVRPPGKLGQMDEELQILEFAHIDVPVEWKAWLQHRRKDPPTEREVMMNHAYTARTLKRAAELQRARGEDDARSDAERSSEVHEPSEASKYPSYDEYEKIAGGEKPP